MIRDQTAFIAIVNMNDPAETELFNWSDSAINTYHPDQSGIAFFEPCILKIPTYTGKVGLDIWGDKPTSSVSNMVISGIRYPDLHKDTRIRDATIEFFIVKASTIGGVSTQSVFKGVIDSVSKSNNTQLLKISSRISELDKSANQKIFAVDTPHSAIHYRNVPMAIGKVLACPLVTTAPILDEFVGCNSNIIEYTDVFDNGSRFDPLAPAFDWSLQWNIYATGLGIKLASPDYGVITADMDGASLDEDGGAVGVVNIFTGLDGYYYTNFVTGGWVVTDQAGSLVTQVGWTAQFVSAAGATSKVEYQEHELIIGQRYQITATVYPQAGAVGAFNVVTGGQVVATIPVPAATTIVTVEFVAKGKYFSWENDPTVAINARVGQNMKLFDVASTGTSTLVNFCKHLFLTAGGIDTAKINWTSFENVEADKNYEIGYFTDKSVNIQTVINELNKSFNSWILESPDGRLTMNYLKNPDGQPHVFEINESNKAGTPKISTDWAKGLKNRIGVRKNYYVFDEDRIAAIVTPQVKALLTKEYRRVRVTNETIHSFYSHAISNCHKDTLLHDTANAIPEIDSVCSLYTKIRYFTEIPVTIDELAIISLDYGDFILFEGQVHVLVGKRFEYANNEITLTLWN